MFRRRRARDWIQHAREFLWPSAGWYRASMYHVRRVGRVQDTPHKVALGLVCGMFASFTPYCGFHFLIAGVCAWVLGGSIIASAIGTGVGNPLTFPLIWLWSFNFGNLILGRQAVDKLPVDLSFTLIVSHPWEILKPLLLPMSIGGGLTGIFVAAVAYLPLKGLIATYQKRRRDILTRRRRGRGVPVSPGE